MLIESLYSANSTFKTSIGRIKADKNESMSFFLRNSGNSNSATLE
jgi:hypothetical protein